MPPIAPDWSKQCADAARPYGPKVAGPEPSSNTVSRGLDDARAALEWRPADDGTQLGIDTDRSALAASSGCGALAARLAQRAADGSAPPID